MWNILLCIGALFLVSVSAQYPHDRLAFARDAKGDIQFLNATEPANETVDLSSFNGEKNVTISIYTKRNPTEAQRISLKDDSAYPNFNPSYKTRFIIHGWHSDGSAFYYFRDAYLKMNLDYNVIIVDWRLIAATNYFSARMYTRLVGEYLAQVIQHMVKKKNLDLDNVFVIGHSLGAHVAGVAGNRLNGKIGRIVGLDPAGPLFAFTGVRDRLDKTDAVFVVVIHTSGGWLGWWQALGHVDFYPNGGSVQPGCNGRDTPACSHTRSHHLYVESIIPTNVLNVPTFRGLKCDTFSKFKSNQCASNPQSLMGEFTPTNASGDYYLETNAQPPYAKG